MKTSKSTSLWKIFRTKEVNRVKYVKPTLEAIELEECDIMLTSNGEGSITANGTTITGKKDDFSTDFGDLTTQF